MEICHAWEIRVFCQSKQKSWPGSEYFSISKSNPNIRILIEKCVECEKSGNKQISDL